MGLLIWTFLVTTGGEVAGLIWWMTRLEQGQTLSALAGLAAGETVELAMFVYYLRQTPGQGGGRRFNAVVAVMVLIAVFELAVWLVWGYSRVHFGLIPSTAILFVLMHLKHDADVATISDTHLARTWFTAKGFAATGLETLGATLAIHFVEAGQVPLAAGLLFVCITVEHLFGGMIVGEALAGRDFLTLNPDRQVGRQNALTVVSSVNPDQVASLKDLLRSYGNAVASTAEFPLPQLQTVHFCCWFIANEQTNPILIFEANFDGPEKDFLSELTSVLQPGLAKIYAHCQGMSDQPTPAEMRDHLTRNRTFTHTFYIGLRGDTLGRIRQEEQLRLAIEEFVDQQQQSGQINVHTSPQEIRRAIQRHVAADPQFDWAKEPVATPWEILKGLKVLKSLGIVAVGIAAVLVIAILFTLIAPLLGRRVPTWAMLLAVGGAIAAAGAALFVALLRWHEKRDPQPDWNFLERPSRDVFDRENLRAINHLANVAPLKTGWVRTTVIQAVLFVVHWAARLKYNRGVLAGTSTIHFARWAVINRGRDLLFLSNYDGSWERYLTDFVDRSSVGLTAIWGNTQEFPRTRWLLFGGAADEENFKAAARRRQVASLLWYAAYSQSTMTNIQNNRAIRAGLFAEFDDENTIAWLRRL